MAKGNNAMVAEMRRRDAEDRTRYDSAMAAANTKSPEETAKEKRMADYTAWYDKHDYSTPPPGLISMDFAAPSARRARRQQELNTAGTGIFALGAQNANPTALAMEKQHMSDEFDRDSAAQYEGDLRSYDAQMRGEQDQLIGMDWTRKSGILGSAGGMSQFSTQARINTQPKSILPGLLSGLIGTAAQVGLGFATGGASTLMGAASSAAGAAGGMSHNFAGNFFSGPKF